MCVLILGLSVLVILVGADVAKAGPSTTIATCASVDPATFTDEATRKPRSDRPQQGKRRDVQRRLTGLGFDTKVNGKFDESTRAVITRWQGARGYPKTGFLNTLQHQALLAEVVSVAHADFSSSGNSDADLPAHHRGGGDAHHHRGGVAVPVA